MHKPRIIGSGAIAVVTAIIAIYGPPSSSNNQQVKQANIQLPITIRQLQSENTIPVEVICGAASVTPPNILNEFQCILKNNSTKSITAATVIYTTVLEEGGKETRDSRTHTLTTYVHPDFYDKKKNISPGLTTSFRSAGIITYENAIIKGVEVYIDYVEFEDNTSIGNEDGARIINDIREGAKKYKHWLGGKYARSVDSAIEALGSEEGLSELGLTNSSQEEGARRYRKQIRKAYNGRGRTEVEKYLSKLEPRN
jgi:hypothetical protein